MHSLTTEIIALNTHRILINTRLKLYLFFYSMYDTMIMQCTSYLLPSIWIIWAATLWVMKFIQKFSSDDIKVPTRPSIMELWNLFLCSHWLHYRNNHIVRWVHFLFWTYVLFSDNVILHFLLYQSCQMIAGCNSTNFQFEWLSCNSLVNKTYSIFSDLIIQKPHMGPSTSAL